MSPLRSTSESYDLWLRTRQKHYTFRLLNCAAFLALFSGSVSQTTVATTLSFALTRIEDTSGDIPVTAYSFNAGIRRFSFCPPDQWKVAGEPSKMTIDAEIQGEQAYATFLVSSKEDIAVLTPGKENQQMPTLISKLPAGHTSLKIISNPKPDFIPLYGFKSVAAEFQYNYFGRDLKSSVIICKMGNQTGFTAVATASVKNYDDFIRKYHGLWGSLQLIPQPVTETMASDQGPIVRPQLQLTPQ